MILRICFVLVVPILCAACRMTPEEIERIQVENELLRTEIRVVKEKCEFYQEVDLRPEDEATSGQP